MNYQTLARNCLAALLVVVAAACGGESPPPPEPTSTGVPLVVDLKRSAEQRVMPGLSAGLQEWVRAQPFFEEVTEAEVTMLEAIRSTERVALRHGKAPVLVDALNVAAAQPWMLDGLDDQEAKGITGLVRAYEAALNDVHMLDIAPLLGKTLEEGLFKTVAMPESGEVTILVASDYPGLGRQALDLTAIDLPKVESLVGEYPYSFLFIWVTDIGLFYAGLSRNEFILLSPEYVEPETVSHEITHATLYGLFPTWFEEGMAYFVEAVATDSIAEKTTYHRAMLASLRLTAKLDIGTKFNHERRNYSSASSQGYLFFNGIYEIEGMEGLGRIVRALRNKTFNNDNELLRAIVTNASPENQSRVQQHICNTVIGVRSGC